MIMPLPLMTGRSQGLLLRRACRGDAEIGNAPKGKEQGEEGKTVLFTLPKPQLWSGTEFNGIRYC